MIQPSAAGSRPPATDPHASIVIIEANRGGTQPCAGPTTPRGGATELSVRIHLGSFRRRSRHRQHQPKSEVPIATACGPRVPSSGTFMRLPAPETLHGSRLAAPGLENAIAVIRHDQTDVATNWNLRQLRHHSEPLERQKKERRRDAQVQRIHPTTFLFMARVLRDMGDGFVAVLLPAYLLALEFVPLQVGVIATASFLGSALFDHRRRNPWRTTRSLPTPACRRQSDGGHGCGLRLRLMTTRAALVIAFAGTISPSAGSVSVLKPVAPNRIRRPHFRFLDLMHVVIPKPRTLSGDMH